MRTEFAVIVRLPRQHPRTLTPKGFGIVTSRLPRTKRSIEFCRLAGSAAMAVCRSRLVRRSISNGMHLDCEVAGLGCGLVGLVRRDDAEGTICLRSAIDLSPSEGGSQSVHVVPGFSKNPQTLDEPAGADHPGLAP